MTGRPYDSLPRAEQMMVDECFRRVVGYLYESGEYNPTMHEHAERLVDAITDYLLASRRA